MGKAALEQPTAGSIFYRTARRLRIVNPVCDTGYIRQSREDPALMTTALLREAFEKASALLEREQGAIAEKLSEWQAHRRQGEPVVYTLAPGASGAFPDYCADRVTFVSVLFREPLLKLSRLPDDEQDAIARNMIEAIESIEAADAQRWEAAFARSVETLDKMADEALAEYRAGRTDPLDPDKL